MANKLQNLIQELCPDGVKFVKLGEVCEMKRGTSATKNTLQAGNIPVISGGREPAFYCNSPNRTGETITIAGSGAGAGYVQYWNEPIFVCDAFSIKGNETLSTKYVYYCLTNLQEKIYATKKGGGVPHVHISSIDKFTIPLPPLAIQSRIVEILDNFSSLTAELQAELQARRSQYEYYRNHLLSFDGYEIIQNENNTTTNNSAAAQGKTVKWVKLGDVCNVQRGASPRPIAKYITEDENSIPWIKIGDIKTGEKYVRQTKERITLEGAKKSRLLHKGDFILSNSMSFGRPYILAIDGCIHDGWASLTGFEDYLQRDYLYHLLNSSLIQNYWKSKVNTSSVSNLNSDIICSTEIPLPSLSEQRRIADILDRFEALTTDLQCGLPAEIQARQQQYEYYRNKLLTFND